MSERIGPRLRTRGLPGEFGDAPFALCLTHDVDRVYKTVQAPFLTLRQRRMRHLRELLGDIRPYWCFDDIMEIEARYDARSSFYFLNEQHLFDLPPGRWLSPANWLQYTGHYRITDPRITDVIDRLDSGGWEVGIHGSYESYNDPDRFRMELASLERVLGSSVTGGRQHYLNLDIPATWRIHRNAGLQYDTSLGSSTRFGFHHGYDPIRPFNDDFLVFPLTAMEVSLRLEGQSLPEAKRSLDALIEEASENGAVMSVLWHVRLFNDQDFPGYRHLYEHLLERARSAGAWIGPVAEAHARLTGVDRDQDHRNTARESVEATGRP